MKILGFLKDKQERTNLIIWFLIAAIGIVVIWGFKHGSNPLHMNVSDNIQQIDLDTIYLKNSGVEVNFSEVILSDQNEMRKLIVSTQQGTVTTELTDRLIKQLDFDFLKKTQSVSASSQATSHSQLQRALSVLPRRQTRFVRNPCVLSLTV